MGFPGGTMVKNAPARAGDRKHGFNPLVGKIPGSRSGNPLQDSSLENTVKGGNWRATAHGVTELDAIARRKQGSFPYFILFRVHINPFEVYY